MTSVNSAGLGAVQFIDVDGLRLRFAKSEKISGDPILLLSPWPESTYAFLPTWEEFSGLGLVVAVDLPGFGGSQGRPDVMAPEAMGEFIIHIVKAFGIDHPHAVGPDVGTPSLLFAARLQPFCLGRWCARVSPDSVRVDQRWFRSCLSARITRPDRTRLSFSSCRAMTTNRYLRN